VVEQSDTAPFNRAKLMNIGAKIAVEKLGLKYGPIKSQHYLCLIFHDIDMIPLNISIPYNCTERYGFNQYIIRFYN
jgi:hypothetical protein